MIKFYTRLNFIQNTAMILSFIHTADVYFIVVHLYSLCLYNNVSQFTNIRFEPPIP